MHVHVEHGDGVAKFWLQPIELASSYRMKARQLKQARLIVEDELDIIKEKWREYFRTNAK